MEAGCGPETIVAAEYAWGAAGREEGAGGRLVSGAGTAAGPIPGPMALVS